MLQELSHMDRITQLQDEIQQVVYCVFLRCIFLIKLSLSLFPRNSS